MSTLLHVHGSDHPIGALLQPLRSAGVQIIDTIHDSETLGRVIEDSGADAAVIAPDVDHPVRVARAIHQRTPEAHIVFVTDTESEPALRRELLFAPRIGTHWSVARADAPAAATETIRHAIDGTVQRRQLRTTVGRMNIRLSRQQPAPRAVVSDHFLAAVLHQLSDGVVMVDTAGTVIAVNDAARSMFGQRLVRGVPFTSALPAGCEHLAAQLAVTEDDASSEVSIPRRGGDLLLEVRLTKVKNERGEEVGTAILARDVTRRRLSEERQRLIGDAGLILASTLELDLAMQRLAEFIADYFSAVVMIDIIEGDAVCRRGAASPPPDVSMGRRFGASLPARPSDHPALAALHENARLVENEVSDDLLRRLTSSEELFQQARSADLRALVGVPITAEGQTIGAVMLVRSVAFTDEEVGRLDELASATATAVRKIRLYHAAEQGNRAKEEFLATLSHELRTPMTSIMGWIQLLRLGDLDEATAREGLAAMEQSARIQAQLIDDLLDLSRIQMGKLHLHIRSVDLAQVVRAAVDTIRPAANAKNITLTADVNDAPVVSGDANRLQQVVWNLLSNSVKFTDGGGRVAVTADRHRSQARIVVADTGNGIDPDFLPFVFDRFRQADAAATRRFGGLGLGLAIVKQIVELHGGTVTAESAGQGRGATFTVSIPITEEPGAESEQPEQEERTRSLRGISVLVVDGDPPSVEVLRATLESAGATVRSASSATAALEELRRGLPDVVVTDLALPDADGFELIQQIRGTLRIPPTRLPVIAVTAGGDLDRRVAILGAGFQRYLQKPIDAALLTHTIAAAVQD